MTTTKRLVFNPHLALDADSPVPLHHQLSEGLTRELRQRRIRRDTYMPTILALARHYGLHRDTVRKAYAVMEDSGVIRRTAGGRLHRVTDDFADSSAALPPTAVGMVLPSRMENLLQPRLAVSALQVVGGIMDAAADLGFTAMVVPLPQADDEVSRLTGWLQTMLSRLNGLIYLGEDAHSRHDRAFSLLLAEQSIPQVFISGHRFLEHLGIVSIDLETGIEAAVGHLHQLGHCRIAVVGDRIPVRPMFQLQTFDRIPAMVAALERRGLRLPEQLLHIGRLGDPDDNLSWLRQTLTRPGRPTAILTDNDRNAARVFAVAAELCLRIPEDLSLIGYGATPNLPPVTTICHPWRESGQAAVDMIAESLRRRLPVNQLTRVLPAPLVHRGTTAKPAPPPASR